MSGRARTILVNGLSTYGRMALGLLVGLLITRTALRVLDRGGSSAKELFGTFTLLVAVSTASGLFNDGLQKSLIRHLAVSTPNDRDELRSIFSSGCIVSWIAGLGVAVTIWLSAPWLASLFQIPDAAGGGAVAVFRVVALSQLGVSLLMPWRAALLSLDRYVLENSRMVSERILVLCSVAALPVTGAANLVGLAVAWQVPQVVTLFVLSVWALRGDAQFRPSPGSVKWTVCKRVMSLGGWGSLVNLSSSLYERTDQVLINLFVGPAGNAIYAVAVQLRNYGAVALTGMTSVLLPTASRLSSQESVGQQRELVVRATSYAVALSLPLAVGLSVFAHPLVAVWLGPGFDAAATILPLVLAVMVLRAPSMVGWIHFTATDKLRWPTIALFADGIGNVGVSVLYVKWMGLGIAGVVAGTITTNLLRFVLFQAPYSARLLLMSKREYWVRAIFRPASAIIWLVPASMLLAAVDDSLVGAFIAALVLGIVYVPWMWFYLFDDYERLMLRRLLRRMPKEAVSNVQ